MARARKDPTDRRPRPSKAGVMYGSSYERMIEAQLRDQARAAAAADPNARSEFRVKLTRAELAKVRAHVDRLVAAELASSLEGWIRDVVTSAARERWVRRPGVTFVEGSLLPGGED